MKFVEELIDYFSELLTEDQLKQIDHLWHINPARKNSSNAPNGISEEEEDAAPDLDEQYGDLYDFPRPDGGRRKHSKGKRRPRRRPTVVSAEELAAVFQKMAKTYWQKFPAALDLYLVLASRTDPHYAKGQSRSSRWLRFLLAVECLKDSDGSVLSDRLADLMKKEKEKPEDRRKLFPELFSCVADGSFFRLVRDFSSQHISGVAAKAFLAALRNMKYPENPAASVDTKPFRTFLKNEDLAGIFNYCRIQRKLEYILSRTIEEAERRRCKR